MLQSIVRFFRLGNLKQVAGFTWDSQDVEQSNREFFHDIIECLVAALEAKDCYTCGHSSRVADLSLDLARGLGITGEALENIHIAAHLHDIGKMGIADNILNKRGKLLLEEWAQIHLHPVIGYNILRKSKKLGPIAKIVLHHHERWDGKGYPHGLRRYNIPLASRIIGVADAVDAMTTSRAYREPMSWKDCYYEVQVNKNKQFDPLVTEAAEKLWNTWAGEQQTDC
ncbi:MAG: 3'3'-cGAMP-specific phosphodiesterase 2 [Dehalococcoidia bacterium]|nr:3'3'-cGAMP-specific phosphodiesterase 2 [Bacillota bacterium]MBT9143831.1 3'3'-cGAMP-specific phosphodiesterase 2 [Bacillota bacterium]